MHFLRTNAEKIIIWLTIAVLTIANFWHVIWYWIVRPAGTVYIGITHYYEDYFYYLSVVKQGALGRWLSENLYTTEVMPRTPLWFVNILIGKIGSLLHLYPWVVYDLAVVSIAALWLWLIYRIIRILLPDNAPLRICAFLITVTSSPYYLVQNRASGELFINPYLYFYNYTSALNRIGGVFHLILQNILTILAVVVAGNIIRTVSDGTVRQKIFIKQTLLVTILLTSLMFINPSYVLVDVGAIAATAALYVLPTVYGYLRSARVREVLTPIRFYLFLAVIAGSALTVSYLVLEKTFSYHFYRYFRDFENSVRPTIPDIFFHSMGIILILAIVGLIPYLKKRDPLRVLGAIYTAIPIILYFTDIPAKLGLPYFRLHQPPAYIFLGIAAAEGFGIAAIPLAAVMHKAVTSAARSVVIRKDRLTTLFFSFLVAGFVLIQIPMIRYEIDERLRSYWLPSWLNTMDKGTFDGLIWLNTQPHDKNALAFNNLEILVPAFSGHRVYVGHKSLTYDYGRKIAETYRFYTAQMSPAEARQFLLSNNIGYILWHQSDGPLNLETSYPFVIKIFDNDAITVYNFAL